MKYNIIRYEKALHKHLSEIFPDGYNLLTRDDFPYYAIPYESSINYSGLNNNLNDVYDITHFAINLDRYIRPVTFINKRNTPQQGAHGNAANFIYKGNGLKSIDYNKHKKIKIVIHQSFVRLLDKLVLTSLAIKVKNIEKIKQNEVFVVREVYVPDSFKDYTSTDTVGSFKDFMDEL